MRRLSRHSVARLDETRLRVANLQNDRDKLASLCADMEKLLAAVWRDEPVSKDEVLHVLLKSDTLLKKNDQS